MQFKIINTRLRNITDFFSKYVLSGIIVILYIIVIGTFRHSGEQISESYNLPYYTNIIVYALMIILPIFWFRLNFFSPTIGIMNVDKNYIDIEMESKINQFDIQKLDGLKLYVKPTKLFFINKNFIFIKDNSNDYSFEILIEDMNKQNELLELFELWKGANGNIRRTWTIND